MSSTEEPPNTMLSADGIAELAGITEPPPVVEPLWEYDGKGRQNPKHMFEREMLEECVTNTRAMRDAVEQIVSQVGEAMNSPMLGSMLKMFGRGK